MELWDGYYKEGTHAGVTLVRGQEIPDGIYHIVCEVLVRHVDGDYLLMQRSYEKPNHGGKYEATAGGSALCGENVLDCVKRELYEETGIKGEYFREISSSVTEKHHCLFHNFFCTVDCDKNAVKLQEGETIGYKWINEQEFIRFVNSDEIIPSNRSRYEPYFKEMGYIS